MKGRGRALSTSANCTHPGSMCFLLWFAALIYCTGTVAAPTWKENNCAVSCYKSCRTNEKANIFSAQVGMYTHIHTNWAKTIQPAVGEKSLFCPSSSYLKMKGKVVSFSLQVTGGFADMRTQTPSIGIQIKLCCFFQHPLNNSDGKVSYVGQPLPLTAIKVAVQVVRTCLSSSNISHATASNSTLLFS